MSRGCDITELPYITAGLPGIGGEIKAEPDHFLVEEIPLYEPSGRGDHVYVRILRRGMNTRDLVQGLARLFDLKETDVGCAGQKDRHAVTIQTFSLYLPTGDETRVTDPIREKLQVEPLWVKRHANKLKTGHLLGNRFSVLLAGPGEGALEKAEPIARALIKSGLPNFYGPQRFGADGDNADKGREILLGRGPRKKWLKNFLLSAFQSQLFNDWLGERIGRGWFERILAGDVAKKTDTGGIFTVEDETVDQARMDAGEITYTGPIFGHKMRSAEGAPAEMEDLVLNRWGIGLEAFKKAGLPGSRRTARLIPADLSIQPQESGLRFDFSLPKGSYATVLLREFTKNEVSAPEE